jgi:hypothetical protein
MLMAAGAAPAPEKSLETKNDTFEKPQSQPTSLKERAVRLLHQIFAGREEYLGWRQ